MNNSQKKRIALIGLGYIATKAYLPIVANHPKIIPVLCTRNKDVLKELKTQYRIDEAYLDIDKLIENKPDAVMIHTTTESHFQLVSKFLDAGIPVFVDKPLCYTLRETELLLTTATENKVLLYLGFNRRFAPLISSLKNEEPIQISWQKNRVDLPDKPRVFIFDDFIHVVDSLRFLGEGIIENLQVFSKKNNGALESIQIQWQQNETLLIGSMNRISGITEERVEFYSKNNKWQVEELVSGIHYKNSISQSIAFDNWDSTLYKRGFVGLIEDWLKALNEEVFNTSRIEDIRETHRVCERILSEIDKKQLLI